MQRASTARAPRLALNREATLLLGAGPRALLLQVAHPLVAEGVAQHSDFRADPWARLAGTLRSYLRIVYGTAGRRTGRDPRLNRLHARVTGPVSTIRTRPPRTADRYSALDPGAVAVGPRDAHRLAARRERPLGEPLSAGDAAGSTRRRGRSVGRSACRTALLPADVEAFDAYVAAMLAPERAGPPERDRPRARPVHPPAAARRRHRWAGRGGAGIGGACRPSRASPCVPQPAVDALLLPAVGLLPARTREEYRLRWGPGERLVDAWLVTAWRFWMPRLPTSLRWFPQALAADAGRRARRAERGRSR